MDSVHSVSGTAASEKNEGVFWRDDAGAVIEIVTRLGVPVRVGTDGGQVALASESAAAAGRFDVVARLARELEARRLARASVNDYPPRLMLHTGYAAAPSNFTSRCSVTPKPLFR